MVKIKFRAWNKIERIMLNNAELAKTAIRLSGEINNVYPLLNLAATLETNEVFETYVLQQFIGLKDKNNKEIYEGDIVKFSYQPYENEKEDSIGEVFFDEGIFYFDRKLTFAANDSNFMKESIEVIGNIFEAPELISKCNQ